MTLPVIIAVAVGIVAVLAVIGYFLGPQRGQAPITRHDEKVIEHRQQRDVLNAYSIARKRVEAARTYVSQQGMTPQEALSHAYREMITEVPTGSAAQAQVANLVSLVTSVLMQHGVLNEVSALEASAAGVTASTLIHAPERAVEVAGVRDLYAWPE